MLVAPQLCREPVPGRRERGRWCRRCAGRRSRRDCGGPRHRRSAETGRPRMLLSFTYRRYVSNILAVWMSMVGQPGLLEGGGETQLDVGCAPAGGRGGG